MAVFPTRDRETFYAHWRRLLADDSLIQRTIVDGDEVAGNIGCWPQDGGRHVGYTGCRKFCGKGLATRPLQELTVEVTEPTVHAWGQPSNIGSIRVLEKR